MLLHVSRPMSMMSGQPVLQSTTMRNCLPPYDVKSVAICWNGLQVLASIGGVLSCWMADGPGSGDIL